MTTIDTRHTINTTDDADLIAYTEAVTGRAPEISYDCSSCRCIAKFHPDVDFDTIRRKFYGNAELQAFLAMKRQFFKIAARLRAEHAGSKGP